MKTVAMPIGIIIGLVAMLIFGIASQAFVLVLVSCGAWTPAMIWIGFMFAHNGVSARALLMPIGIIMGLGVAMVTGISANIIPLVLVGCGGIIPALIFAGWSLARAGGEPIAPKMPTAKTPSTILTADEIARLEQRKLAKMNARVVTSGEFE